MKTSQRSRVRIEREGREEVSAELERRTSWSDCESRLTWRAAALHLALATSTVDPWISGTVEERAKKKGKEIELGGRDGELESKLKLTIIESLRGDLDS